MNGLTQKYFAKCSYCGFCNNVEVETGFEPKHCCLCGKETKYESEGMTLNIMGRSSNNTTPKITK